MLKKVSIVYIVSDICNITQICRNDYYSQNTYLIYLLSEKVLYIVDPGDNAEVILEEVVKLRITPSAILLTHGHFDHLGAAAMLSKEFDIPCYCHEDDHRLLKKAANYALLFEKKRIIVPVNILMFESLNNSSFKIIHTPGHTAGSCCFSFGNFICTGDTLLFEISGRTDLPGGSDILLSKSLKKLKSTLDDNATVLPGHGKIFKFADCKINI